MESDTLPTILYFKYYNNSYFSADCYIRCRNHSLNHGHNPGRYEKIAMYRSYGYWNPHDLHSQWDCPSINTLGDPLKRGRTKKETKRTKERFLLLATQIEFFTSVESTVIIGKIVNSPSPPRAFFQTRFPRKTCVFAIDFVILSLRPRLRFEV